MIIEVIRGLNMGGAETLLYTRLRYAATHLPDVAEKTIVVNTLAGNDYYTQALRDLGIEVVELRTANPVFGMIELRRFLRKRGRGARLVFHSPVTTYIEKTIRAFGGRDRGGSIVDVVHSTRYRRAYRIIGALLDQYADRAIAVSDDVAQSAPSRHYRQKVTILAGVDIARMRHWIRSHPNAARQMRNSLGLPARHNLIVSVGSLIPLKGHRHVIEALKCEALSDVSYVLVGAGPEESRLRRLADEIGVGTRVYFVGRVSEGWRWAAVADAVVHPSTFEGLSVAMIEAAALGVPIVATDVGGLRQIVHDDNVGVLIDEPSPDLIADALARVLSSVPLREQVFQARAPVSSRWNIARYIHEFYSAL